MPDLRFVFGMKNKARKLARAHINRNGYLDCI